MTYLREYYRETALWFGATQVMSIAIWPFIGTAEFWPVVILAAWMCYIQAGITWNVHRYLTWREE